MRNLEQEHMDWRQRRVELVDLFAKRMYVEYNIKERWTVMTDGKLRTIKAICHARELINDPLARLIYIVEFCKRNYGMRNLTLYNI